jgi:hypothetical protein
MITSKSLSTGGLGRFGNQMFTIAGCIGIALKSGQPYAFPEWITKDNEIFGQKPDNINDYLVKPLPPLADWSNFLDYGYFWGYKDVYLPIGNWSIDAHMQSEKFFKHCLPLIRETFTFKDEPEQNDYVAIHYRAGDYIDDPNAQHPRCGVSYYMDALIELGRPEDVLIFSDDKLYAKAFFSYFLGDQVNIVDTGSYINDFKLMKKCKSFITANSSFSLMAAILGDHPEKKIVCPRRWFGSQMPPEFNTDDIYPENAIIL